ncbi:MAG: hypothetical protein BroJett013_28560 [Alphaproteobacteria bacterium]|nr:MAG: hypothetical protein BroJett013_28560 [Alphaproteobacteria bacterium]
MFGNTPAMLNARIVHEHVEAVKFLCDFQGETFRKLGRCEIAGKRMCTAARSFDCGRRFSDAALVAIGEE